MIKKTIAILLVLTLLLSTSIVSFAETEALVTKVVFKNMTSSLRYVAMGGIRFYNNDELIESGPTLSANVTEGETEQFRARSEIGDDTNSYFYLPYPLETSKPQSGGYRLRWYWCGDETKTPQDINIEFKTHKAVDKIEFVPLPDTITDRGITNDFTIEVHYDNDQVQSYDITPITSRNTVQTLNIEAPTTSLALNITSDEDTLTPNDIIDVNVQLSGATDIFAEDITVTYDTEAFELLGEAASDTDAYSILHTDKSDGSARYIVAGKTATSGITGEDDFITLQFKAKNYVGTSDISFSSGLVADSSGNEFEPTLNSKTFTINGFTDVNATGTFTLGDLAITSSLIATASTEWGEFTPDVDVSGGVDDVDLAKIVEEMLK